MRIIFLGKKALSSDALRYLHERGCEITAVVAPTDEDTAYWHPKLGTTARELRIPVADDEELYKCLADPDGLARKELRDAIKGVDLVISFLFWKKIREPLIALPRLGCINFHPAPLPDFRGVGGYNIAIMENLSSWGVSCHFVDASFDTGTLIKVNRFPIQPEEETALSLERKTQPHLLALFREVVDRFIKGERVEGVPQNSHEGSYVSKKEFETMRKVTLEDSPEMVRRKIRAFWFPPHGGAALSIGGEEFTLVDESRLKEIGTAVHSPQKHL